MKPFLKEKIIKEAINEIAENFKKETSLGPVLVGTFMNPVNEDAQRRAATDSFMRINKFLEFLGK